MVTALDADKDMAMWRKILKKAVFMNFGNALKNLIMLQVAPLHDIRNHIALLQTDGAFLKAVYDRWIMGNHDNRCFFNLVDFLQQRLSSSGIWMCRSAYDM